MPPTFVHAPSVGLSLPDPLPGNNGKQRGEDSCLFLSLVLFDLEFCCVDSLSPSMGHRMPGEQLGAATTFPFPSRGTRQLPGDQRRCFCIRQFESFYLWSLHELDVSYIG